MNEDERGGPQAPEETVTVVSFGQWRWTPVAIAVIAFTLVVGGGLALTRASDEGDSGAAVPTTDATNGAIGLVGAETTAAPVPDTATVTTVVATNAVANRTTLGRTLSNGLSGPDVQMVQQRLADLKFDPGPVDGVYGTYTAQAVWAFETLVLGAARKDMTGTVTPDIWERMQDDVTLTPRRTNLTSTHVEIYLPEQALIVFKDNVPELVAHISSGELEVPDVYTKGKQWCSEVTIDVGELGNETGTEPIKKGVCGNAETPGGTYRFYRKVEGRRESRLGGMYDPVYFNNGIAVHGAGERPGRSPVARLHPDQPPSRTHLPVDDHQARQEQRRSGLHLERGEGTRGLRRPLRLVRLDGQGMGGGAFDHDVDLDHIDDDARHGSGRDHRPGDDRPKAGVHDDGGAGHDRAPDDAPAHRPCAHRGPDDVGRALRDLGVTRPPDSKPGSRSGPPEPQPAPRLGRGGVGVLRR